MIPAIEECRKWAWEPDTERDKKGEEEEGTSKDYAEALDGFDDEFGVTPVVRDHELEADCSKNNHATAVEGSSESQEREKEKGKKGKRNMDVVSKGVDSGVDRNCKKKKTHRVPSEAPRDGGANTGEEILSAGQVRVFQEL